MSVVEERSPLSAVRQPRAESGQREADGVIKVDQVSRWFGSVVAVSDVYDEDGIPHVDMLRRHGAAEPA